MLRAALLALLLLCSTATQALTVDSVRVYKSERKMQLLEKGKVVREYRVALGGNPIGHKRQEGDSRTPEGRYVLDYKNANSAFHRSIHISYPDARDRAAAKKRGVSPGGQIMIHGQPNGYGHLAALTQKRDWTDGCIALTDEQMDEVWRLVPIGTPIDIHP